MTECEQILLKGLEVDSWYIGRGRRANIGLWNGNNFSVLANCGIWAGSVKATTKSEECIKHENYYTSEKGSFQPFLKVDFGETIDKMEDNGCGGGYGKRIRFSTINQENI
jgi:hypothetical protein